MSFVPVQPDSHFSLQNIPFGVYSLKGGPRRIGTAIGDHVLCLHELSRAGLLEGTHVRDTSVFSEASLNRFMSLGRPAWREVRSMLQRLLSANEGRLRDDQELLFKALIPMDSVTMHLPARIGDYTDFYTSKEHATNCGIMLRGPEQALAPNWIHLPVGYHGRSSSIVVSGTDVRRPRGQVLLGSEPAFSACNILDFELEVGVFIGSGNALGDAISVDEAKEHIFGLVLLNDWSARDIQKWEMVPLGPFNSKNFASSISPWIVTLDALEAFRCDAPAQEPAVLPYLQEKQRYTYDIQLEAALQPEGSEQATTVTQTNFKLPYWTIDQMVAHHTVGGCNLQPGDLIGTGTISSEGPKGPASLLELSWQGTRKVKLDTGEERTFLKDGDTVILSGFCQGDGYRVGFGTCKGKVLPAHLG